MGNYVLRERVGLGAFAEVWKAVHHERRGRIVAIKIATDPAFRRQMSREGRLPDIDHPNVAPILDSDTRFADLPYVVMPYYSDGSLADLIARHPRGLPEDRVAALLRDILAGLAAAHALGVVHRDLKPANVLLDESGRGVICDFGLSLQTGDGGSLRSLAQSASLSLEQKGALVGTFAYMAPEVREGQPATAAADVYAVGVVLFEMLTGRRPAGLELPSQVRADLHRPQHWDGWFYWACRPLAERYPDASAMALEVSGAPRPMPLGPAPATPWPAVPSPAQVSDDLWEALIVRWEERQRIDEMSAEHAREIEANRTIYTESHRVMRDLRHREGQLTTAKTDALDRVREVCARICESIDAQAAPFEQRRDRLLAEGCLPNHPDVQSAEQALAPLEQLRAGVELLPAGDLSHRLVRCVEYWSRLRQHPRRQLLKEFLTAFGRDPLENPYCNAAALLLPKRGFFATLASKISRVFGGSHEDAPLVDEQLRALIAVTVDQWGQGMTLLLPSGVTIELVLIPAGEFMMGSPESEPRRDADEGPRHRVTISRPFYMGKYEVTQAQWQAVMGGNPSYFKGDRNLPVENVSWNDCQEFCRKLSIQTGRAVRLPSEAEWEYACRAGTTTPFSFGPTISTDQANYDGRFTYGNGVKGMYREMTTPVRSFPANAWGLHDMHGNVWEWCEDCYHGDYNGAPADARAWTRGGKKNSRVLRGGAWNLSAKFCRAANRLIYSSDGRYADIGFRVVVVASGTP